MLYSGSRVRITAHLIEAATDRQLWARRYERDVSEILALQSSVASDIAAEVPVTRRTVADWQDAPRPDVKAKAFTGSD